MTLLSTFLGRRSPSRLWSWCLRGQDTQGATTEDQQLQQNDDNNDNANNTNNINNDNKNHDDENDNEDDEDYTPLSSSEK
jgi:hypothetical protein